MPVRQIHVDEITAWTWIAAAIFVVLAVAAVLSMQNGPTQVADNLALSVPPIAQPMHVPPEAIADPNL